MLRKPVVDNDTLLGDVANLLLLRRVSRRHGQEAQADAHQTAAGQAEAAPEPPDVDPEILKRATIESIAALKSRLPEVFIPSTALEEGLVEAQAGKQGRPVLRGITFAGLDPKTKIRSSESKHYLGRTVHFASGNSGIVSFRKSMKSDVPTNESGSAPDSRRKTFYFTDVAPGGKKDGGDPVLHPLNPGDVVEILMEGQDPIRATVVGSQDKAVPSNSLRLYVR